MRFTALALLAAAGLSVAQNDDQYSIDPSTVRDSDRAYWCTQQENMCPLICLQQPGVSSSAMQANDCDADNLTFNCVCENGVSPNVTEYTQTLPYFICTQWGTNCVAGCGSDNKCSSACREDHPCGAKDPVKGNATASSTSSSSPTASQTSADESIPATGFPGATSTASAQGGASSVLDLGASYGLALTFAGVFAGFALL